MAGIVSLPTLGGGQAWPKTPIPAPWMVLSWSTMWLSFLHSDGRWGLLLASDVGFGAFLGRVGHTGWKNVVYPMIILLRFCGMLAECFRSPP